MRKANKMDGVSFTQHPEEELVFALCTTFNEDNYYEGATDRVKRVQNLLTMVSPEFAAKAAIFIRREMHMRSASHILAGELAKILRGKSFDWKRRFFSAIVERPDDMSEIISVYWGQDKNKSSLPNFLKRGFADRIAGMSEYDIAKYKLENRKVKMVDIINLTHPKVDEKHGAAQLIRGTLAAPETWEVKKSKGEKDVFKHLLDSGKIGYMALIRNLRNIIEQESDATLNKAIALLTDPARVAGSKQLPFRFLSAYDELSKIDSPKAKKAMAAVDTALRHACQNIPQLSGKTMILCDNSGSMRGDSFAHSGVSSKSNRKTSDIANLFGVMCWLRSDDTYFGIFGDNLEEPKLDKGKGLIENFRIADRVGRSIGGGTEHGVFLALKNLIKTKEIVDRIILFSDCQCGEGCALYGHGAGMRGGDFNALLEAYRQINPNVKVYSVDLKGYGDSLIDKDAVKVSGWSDAIFDIIVAAENGKSMVEQIKQITL